MDSYKRIFLISITFLALILSSPRSPVFAFDTEVSRSTLRGLQGVNIEVIGGLESDSESDSLNLDEIKKDMELELKTANIKVLSGVEFLRTKGRPFLFAKVKVFKREAEYICSILIQLYQHVYLMDKPQSETYPAVTWSSGGIIVVMPALENIRELVKNETGKFIEAYLSANRG